jgi:hypothetical protein
MQADIRQVDELTRNFSELRQTRWFPVHLKSPITSEALFVVAWTGRRQRLGVVSVLRRARA